MLMVRVVRVEVHNDPEKEDDYSEWLGDAHLTDRAEAFDLLKPGPATILPGLLAVRKCPLWIDWVDDTLIVRTDAR